MQDSFTSALASCAGVFGLLTRSKTSAQESAFHITTKEGSKDVKRSNYDLRGVNVLSLPKLNSAKYGPRNTGTHFLRTYAASLELRTLFARFEV